MPPQHDGHISAAVHATQDAFSSTMAALIGHVQVHTVASHPSSHAHLIELTREAIDRVRDLLGLMEGIVRRSSSRPTVQDPRVQEYVSAMDRERSVLYETTGALVEAAEVVASTPYRDAPTPTDERNKQALLDKISAALKDARECCRLCKACAVATGDWEMDGTLKPGLGQSSAVETTYEPDRGHGRTSSVGSMDGRERTKFGWETTDDEDEEELINTLDEEDYTLHSGSMMRQRVGTAVFFRVLS